MENLIEKAAKLSLNNSSHVAKSKKCGCYYCCGIFDAKEVKSFIDEGETALCPVCGVDAVIPGSIIENLTSELLSELKKYWF